jgi:hypothetical protein
MLNSNEKAVRKAIATMFPDRYNRQNWRTLLFEFVNDSLKPIIIRWFNNWEDSINGKEERPSLDFPPELTPAAELLAKQEELTYAQLAIYHYIHLNQMGAVQAKYIGLAGVHKTSHSHHCFEHLERPVDLSGDFLSQEILKYFIDSTSFSEANIEALSTLTRTEFDEYDQLLGEYIDRKQSELGETYAPAQDAELPRPSKRLYSAITLLAAMRGLSYQDLAWDEYMVRSEKENADNALASVLSNNALLLKQIRASTSLIKTISDPDSRQN